MPASPAPSVFPLTTQVWTYGTLLAFGDTQMFELAGDGSDDDVVVWVEGGGGAVDVDLYVSRNTQPSLAVADFRRRSSRAGEAVQVPGGSKGSVFAAVQSYSGPLWYRIHAARVRRTNILSNTVGFSFVPSASDVSLLKSQLMMAKRRFFGLTNGRRWIGDLTVSALPPNGGCPCVGNVECDTCVRSITGTSAASFSTFPWRPGVTLYRNGWSSARVISHEWAHFSLHVQDEYWQHVGAPNRWTDAWCAPSAMGTNIADRLCTTLSHGTSGDTPTHICPNQAGYSAACFMGPAAGFISNWDYISQAFDIENQTTLPEDTDYTDFDWLDPLMGRAP